MSEASLVIRSIEDRDWEQVYEIFSSIVAEGDTYAYREGLSSHAARALWVEGPPSATIVALRDNVIVGTAKFGANRPGRGAHVATASFMVDAGARSTGVGRALCEYAVTWAKEKGYAGMQFNAVASSNIHAIALYTQLGFVTIGTVPGAFDSATFGRVGLDIMFLEF
jgi:L-amino acid N-acyltransferase YncA